MTGYDEQQIPAGLEACESEFAEIVGRRGTPHLRPAPPRFRQPQRLDRRSFHRVAVRVDNMSCDRAAAKQRQRQAFDDLTVAKRQRTPHRTKRLARVRIAGLDVRGLVCADRIRTVWERGEGERTGFVGQRRRMRAAATVEPHAGTNHGAPGLAVDDAASDDGGADFRNSQCRRTIARRRLRLGVGRRGREQNREAAKQPMSHHPIRRSRWRIGVSSGMRRLGSESTPTPRRTRSRVKPFAFEESLSGRPATPTCLRPVSDPLPTLLLSLVSPGTGAS